VVSRGANWRTRPRDRRFTETTLDAGPSWRYAVYSRAAPARSDVRSAAEWSALSKTRRRGGAKIGPEITRGNVNGRAEFHRPAAYRTNLVYQRCAKIVPSLHWHRQWVWSAPAAKNLPLSLRALLINALTTNCRQKDRGLLGIAGNFAGFRAHRSTIAAVTPATSWLRRYYRR